MQREIEEFQKRDARVAGIGMGTGGEAAALADRLGLSFPLLGSPEHEAYDAFGLVRDSWWGLLGRPLLSRPLSAVHDLADADLRAAASPRSDVKRLGGVAVVDRAGRLRYLHRAARSDDIPSNRALWAELDALRASG